MTPVYQPIPFVFANGLTLQMSFQWMGGGSHGLYGQGVPRLVAVVDSRGTEFVMGPFLGGSLALVNEKRSDTVMKKDAQVNKIQHSA